MDKIYYSPQNFQLIFKNLNNDYYQKYKVELSLNQCRNNIIKSMDYVWKNVEHEAPKGYSKEKYLYLLNNKIINISKNLLKPPNNNYLLQQKQVNDRSEFEKNQRIMHKNQQTNNSNNNVNIVEKNKNTLFDKMFDGLTSREMPNEMLEPPQPQDNLKKNLNYDNDYNNFMEMRDNLLPKKKNVNFEDVNFKLEQETPQNFDNKLEQKLSERKHLEIDDSRNVVPNDNESVYGTPIEQIYSSNDYNFQQIDNDANIDDEIEEQSANILENIYSNSNKITNIDNNKETFENKLTNNNAQNIDNNIIIDAQYDNQKLYKMSTSINDLNNDSSDFKDYHSNIDSVILPPKNNFIQKNYFVSVNSLNRDLEVYPNPTNFQVKFSPSVDSTTIQNYYSRNNILIFKEKVIYYGNQGAIINRNYNNILDIKCSCAIIPQIYNKNNIRGQPLILLNIPELEGPYEGSNKILTNCFAKLILDTNKINNIFGLYSTYDHDEIYMYSPTSLGKLDKMTLELKKHNENDFFVGIDKLYVSSFVENSLIVFDDFCKNNYTKTQIYINSDSQLYKQFCDNCALNKTYIGKDDLLYFFDMSPEECDVIYFEKNVTINSLTEHNEDSLLLTGIVSENQYFQFFNTNSMQFNENSEKLKMDEIFYKVNEDYYIYLSYSNDSIDYINNVFLKVISIQDDNIIIEKFDDYDPIMDYQFYSWGYTFTNKKGRQSNNKSSFFSKYGHHVSSVDDSNGLIITIDYPYENLPEYLLTPNNYVFFIQDKLQINYTFKVTELIKDNYEIESRLNF